MKKKLYHIILLSSLFPLSYCDAQVVYSQWANPAGHYTFSRTPNSLCLGVLTCPQITNPARSADNDLTNYTTIQFPVLSVFSQVVATLDLTATVNTGNRGGVYLRSGSDLLSLSVLPNITIELLNNSTVVGTESYSSLLSLHLLQTVGLFVCADPNSQPYNKVRLTISVPIGVGVPLEFFLYYAYGNNELQCLNGVLPANNVNLKLQPQKNCSVELNWEPEYGDQTDHYVIQRQNKFSDDWINIGAVMAHSGADVQKDYSYTDILNKSGSPSYRLLAVGKRGEQYYHSAKRISLNCGQSFDKKLVTITNGRLNIQLPENISRPSLLIYDITGRAYKIIPSFSSGSSASINTNGLPNGIYILRITDRTFRENIKFIIASK